MEPSLDGMRQRPYAYSDVFRHPPLGGSAWGSSGGHIREDIDPAVARVCKNESNCTVFLRDGTWLTTWGQGSHEGHPDQRIVCATSCDTGRTWSQPITVQESNPARSENVAYGVPFVVPETGRVYVFYFLTVNTEGPHYAATGSLKGAKRAHPLHQSGTLHFVYSDDGAQTWSRRYPINLPPRAVNVQPGAWHAWVNHPPVQMPTGEVLLTFSATRSTGIGATPWQLGAAEANVLRCDNLCTEDDPAALQFTLLPEGAHGIRTNLRDHWDNPALQRHVEFWKGEPDDTGWSLQELTLVALADGRWLGVGRTYLGSPGYTISEDRGTSWSRAEPLCWRPGGEPIPHPMTMCPIAPTSDGRIVLLFTNNDGSARGAQHVWDGDGRTRNPQWMAVARQVEDPSGKVANAGLVFDAPVLLAEVDDSGETNLKTGISMPQFFERENRWFVCYNIDKEHLLLDEVSGVAGSPGSCVPSV
ncbi:MAG: exo-alpha-sialidase [Gemmatimonadetes bacterium]|nr:exo-alpha-sialidase [Gemmatimonadota bacterium]MBT6144527.1 exo-alpha-sialidase [Gemmatimonadota bacterium]MBT7860893.1 exo-alpha-sialidase [Gemmatimonadota bacterium]